MDRLAASGRFLFASVEMQDEVGISAAAARSVLSRLAAQKLVASPARGLYLILPPEYRSLGALPAAHFVPELMGRLGQRYYVGLLSAAQYHGAGHQRPQAFQVVLQKNRRPVRCGRVHVAFVARRRMAEVPTHKFNTPYGSILVSSPEATALDLVGYAARSGGLANVVGVLADLVAGIQPADLVLAARTAPVSWAQRLGHLLEALGAAGKAEPLHAYVCEHAREPALLGPRRSGLQIRRDARWKLDVNVEVEAQVDPAPLHPAVAPRGSLGG